MSREGVSGMSGSESATRGASSAGELSGPRCILPGCRNGAEEQGLPCGECAEAFGSHLRQTEGPAMTVEVQTKRDNKTQAAYAVLLAGGDPARVTAAGGAQSTAAGTPAKDPERKANQRCWLCEERRTCTRQVRGWECDVCREVR